MNRSLLRASVRYARTHWLQFGLAIAGVAVGVAVVTSIDLATGSASAAFELSTETVNGRTTHQIYGGPTGLDETIYGVLRREGFRSMAPVVEEYIFHGPNRQRLLTLLGVDPMAEAPFRNFLGSAGEGSVTALPAIDLATLLTHPGAVVLSEELATELGLRRGDPLTVEAKGQEHELLVAGTFDIGRGKSAVKHLLVADIATAQELTRSFGRLSRIDLRFEEPEESSVQTQQALASLTQLLPAGVELRRASQSSEAARQMTQAFRWNLNALSLLALVCGTFLVFNTMSFSIVQRRRHLGILRALGVRRQEIFFQILMEALLLGLAGCAIGVPLGIFLATHLVGLVTQTVNDLYFVVQVSQLKLSTWTLLKGLGLGLVATLVASLYPAREATHSSPRAVMMRSVVEAKARKGTLRAVAIGVCLLLAGLALLTVPTRSLLISLTSLFLVLLGCALCVPVGARILVRLLTPLAGYLWGWVGRLAAKGIVASLSRTAVALAALTVAVSVSIGVGVMTQSFRTTVENWLGYSLPADFYISPARQLTRSGMALPGAWRDTLQSIPGVERVNTVKYQKIVGQERTFSLVAVDMNERSFSAFELAKGDQKTTWNRFLRGEAVLVSEPFSYRYGLNPGDLLDLPTPNGKVQLPIAAVYYDYASEQGAVMIHHDIFKKHWQVEGQPEDFAGFAVYLAPGAQAVLVGQQIEKLLPQKRVPFLVRSNLELRNESLEIFDRTFLITGILRQLATIVAFLGILSALMALQLERARELGVLRAIGLTRRQVWTAVTVQNGMMGLVAGLLALPIGTALAAILIFVINKRSFGWSLSMEVPSLLLLEALAVSMIAALAAGVYPARKMAATSPAEALRGE